MNKKFIVLLLILLALLSLFFLRHKLSPSWNELVTISLEISENGESLVEILTNKSDKVVFLYYPTFETYTSENWTTAFTLNPFASEMQGRFYSPDLRIGILPGQTIERTYDIQNWSGLTLRIRRDLFVPNQDRISKIPEERTFMYFVSDDGAVRNQSALIPLYSNILVVD